MYRGSKIAVVIAAAGSGKRMKSVMPKQYLELRGKPILTRTAEAFSINSLVDEIYIVADKDYIEVCNYELIQKSGLQKIKGIIAGGRERQDSVFNALERIPEYIDYVLVHDGARPFVTDELITELIESTCLYGAAAVAVPVKDTIKVSDGTTFTATPDRSSLFAVQTPQGFSRELLLSAYKNAFEQNFYGTDDAVLVEKFSKKVYLVKGDYNNIKITTKEDLAFAEALAAEQPDFNTSNALNWRVGAGYDVHKLVSGRKLILGGVEINFEKGLLGHSDADVLTHAVMDALLGAAALGDIGRHFPDTDNKYKGISSLLLLKKVAEMLREKGWGIGNIDAVVIAQKPKISPYISEITRLMAENLMIDQSKINIKGTTTEGLGFCGREEGIAAQASVLIKKEK